MNILLNDVEARVLGSLVEKDVTTPDYYPLSLNALVNACNPTSSADSRVTKHEHRLQEVFNFTRGETAILFVLLLRGPQTPGELRGRTERMQRFEDLTDVQSTLQRLMQREPALARVLPRQPGTKEARYMHLLSGDAEDDGAESASVARAPSPASARSNSADGERIARLENELKILQEEVASLKQQLASFRKQFE